MVGAFSEVNARTIDLWFVGLILALLVLLLWRIFAVGGRRPGRSSPFHLSPDVSLTPQAFLTDSELLLYNLIRMAVQDRYLVFAQVPLWGMLSVEGTPKVRTDVLRHLALKRADFVLVHPGSRLVQQVVQLGDEYSAGSDDLGKESVVQKIVQAAGIRFTRLDVQQRYTIQELERLLDVTDSE